jgi:glutamate-ammonia-ligase adenylyltransferase
MVDRNIKLGRGGIRELEFIVQSLTLIYGGRDARIRCLGTFDALSRLALHGYLPHETSRRLADAYRFLRDVEHKLQAVAGLQTHSIPAQPAAIRALAARLKLGKDDESIARLNFRLGECRALIARQFRETLAGGGDSLQLSSEAANQAWRAAENPEASAPILARMGFANGQASARALAGLASGHFGSAASPPRRSEILTRLGPILIDEISRLPDPDLAIVHLNDFMAAVGARSSFLALLEQHPATRRILLRLFASSAYLSTIFIRHPDMLDTLVRSDIARAQRAGFEMARELDELMAASPDFESRLDALRAFRHQEFLRIAIGDLAGSLDIREVENELTVLAETVLRAALTVARDEVAVRYPDAAAPAMAVIAMGRLGAAEMSYNSDLDLIFIHDDAAEAAGAAREVAWRIAQKLIAVLESRTREGYAYKLDLRLRPSGNAGPLVTSLGGFREYHRLSSAVWERQALVRARVVAGDDALARAVENARVEFVFGRAITAAEVAEIRAMRMRMEREIGVENRTRINLKQGRGGLVDVEFVAQMIALRHGYSDAAMRERNTTAMLQAMAANPAWRESALALEDDYLFLTRLENRLRIESDQASWALPTAPELIHPLARRMGYEGAQAPHRMLAELADRRDRIRAAFDRFFSSEERTEP